MRVSIIIPTYNRAALLPKALDSLFAQTRQPDEIIVVDDGSTDNTPEVLSRYDVTVIRQENQGLPAARNAGIDAAQNYYLMFLDDDDLLPPNSIERFLDEAAGSPYAGVIYSDTLLIDPDGKTLGRLSEHYPINRPSGFIFAELAQHNLFTVNSALVKRASLSKLRFDVTLKQGLEDFDFWLRLATQYAFKYVDEPLAYYCLHPDSMSRREVAMREAEVEVQRRVFEMSEFKRLKPQERARIHCSHGIKNAMLDRMPAARMAFRQALITAPTYPPALVLTLSSLLGQRVLEKVVMMRRQAAGHRSWNEIIAKANQ